MASFSKWSNNKKKTESGTATGAQSFSQWSNSRRGAGTEEKSEPVMPQTYRSQNAGHERSGLTRDEYDSRVRSGYAERAAKQAAPATPEQSTSRKYNTGSVLQLGYGPISTERLEQLISTGAVTAQERNGQTYVSRAQQTAPARPGMPSALQPSLPSSFARQPAAAPAEEKKTYYSQPELGVDTEKLKTAATELEPTVTKKYEALQSATTRATELENSLKFIEGHLQTLYDNYQQNPTQAAAQLYENAYASYEQKHAEYETAVQTYNTAYQEYAPLYDQYSSAVAAYNNYVEQQQAQFKDWKSTIRTEDQIQADEDALDVQIDALKKQQSQLATSNTQLQSGISRARGYGSVAGLEEKYKANQEAIAELQAQLDELESSKALLKEERDWAEHYQYADLMEAQDWQQLSAPTAAKREADDLNLWKIGQKRGDDKYDFINDIDDYRMTVGALSLMTQQQNEYGDYTQYSYMNEDEIGIYNYLYAKQGKEAADEYLGYLEETLNYRWGLATAEDKDTDFERIMWAIPSGIDRFGTGIAQLFSKEDLPTTYTQYASQAVRQELGGVGGVAYDFLQTVSNMAPSILLSVATSGLASGLGAGTQLAATVGKVAGTGTMSLSAAGNAYNEKVKAGYDPDEARTYAALVGASEGLLQYALGGISKLGTGVNGGMLAQKIAGIDSAFGRIAANWGYSMFKEGFEEGLQEVLEPVFSSMIFNEQYDPATLEQVTYSFLLGAMSAGMLEGGDVVRTELNTQGTGAQFREMGDDVVQAIIDTGLESGQNTASYKIAMELKAKLDAGETITDYELGRLYGENVQTVATEEKAQRQNQRAEVNEFLSGQPETEPAAETGAVLPTAAEVYGRPDTTTPETQAPVTQRRSMMREPGMLPTAEDAELQERLANAQTEAERSGIEAGANDEAIEQAVRLSSVLGKDIVFYNEAASGTGIRNGKYAGGKIYVNVRSQNPLAQIISHELTHSVEMADAYRDLSGIVMNRILQTGENLQQLRQEKIALYARNDAPLSEADADAEIVAEYVEKYLLTDEQSIMELTRENRTLSQRILGWINDLLAKLGNASAQERAFLMHARDAYASALEQTQSSFNAGTAAAEPAAAAEAETGRTTEEKTETETALEQLRAAYAHGELTDEEFDAALDAIMQEESTADESMLETKNSFGGVNANGADLESLRQAEAWEKEGLSPRTIFYELGWFRGADGKWRFEIDDSGMQFNKNGTPRNPDEARRMELDKKFNDGTITQEEWDEYRNVTQATRGMQKQTTLAGYLQHEELFRNYPQLRKATLQFSMLEDGALGSYNPDTNTITLSDELRTAPEDTLVHEIQHAIQKAEGFARGSSPESWDANTASAQRVAAVERIRGEISALEDMINSESEEESADLIRADIEELQEKLDRLSYHLYENTAGEVEARDAASRRRMTPEQRRQTMPDTGDENTVFAEDADEYKGAQFSITEIEGEKENYGAGVLLDTNLFDGVNPRDWGSVLGSYVYKNMAGRELTMYDEAGNPETVELARETDRVRKDGAKNSHKVLDKLAGYRGDSVRAKAVVQLAEVLATSRYENTTDEHSHQWMDEGGWEIRKAYLQDTAGNIYEATLNIANGRDRRIMYEINRVHQIDKKRTSASIPEADNSQQPGGAQSGDSAERIAENGLPVKEQFSITEPVEQTQTLLALHNMDEEKLRRTLNLGAWPSPSIAIVEAAQGHSNYGEYSVVFPRSVIDPEADSRNKVYGSDAWTPTWRNAQIEYEVNYDKKSALERRIAELSKTVANGIFSRGSVISSRVDDTSSMDAKALAERLAGDDTVRAAYLAETGGTLKPVLKSKEWNKYGNGVLQKLIDEIGVQELARINAEMEAGEDRIAPAKGVEDTVRKILRDDYEQKFRNMLDRKPESKQKRLDSYIENNVSIFTVESIVRDAWRMYEDGGATKGEIDRNATQDELREATNEEDVAAWLLGQMDGLLGEPGIYNNKEPYTASGNRRSFKALHYDYNAENIVRAMNEAAERGEGYWGAGAEGMMAMATPEYANVDEMHADEARLYTETEEQRKERFAKLDDEIMQIISEVKRTTKAHSDSSYQESDIVGGILMQTATEQKTEKGVKRAFAKEGYAISDVLAKRIADMYREAAKIPTGYFEAKPQRVVDFDEALAVLAPTDAPAELVAALRNAGMNVMEYNAGDEQSRLEVINSIDGAKFSISEDGDRYNGTAVLEEETIDKYLKDYAAPSSPNYAQAYIAYISPEDFIRLTTSTGGRDLIERQSHALDMEEFKDSTRHQPLQMRIDHETGEVEGHEGRHRAAALGNAGVQRVPVLLFDSSNKYDKTAIDILTLTGQDFGNTRSNAEVDVFDVQPFSYANRETLLKKYGRQPTQERIAENYGRKTVRYSVSEDENAVPEAQLPTAEDTDVISTLPVKAQDYLKRAERTLVSTIGNALSVPKFARREYLNGIVREISTEYLESGAVSQETIDRLFDRAYDEGVEVDSEYYDQYKDIKDHLRTQAITISERDKGDIADFNDFRKSAFGTLRIVNDGGLPVDVAYMKLQGMAGELFPEDITHPADQLTRMYEVARSIEKTERSLDEYYGRDAEEFRKWAKNDFDVAVSNALSELRNVKRFVDERAQSTSGGGTPTTQAEVTEMYGQLKDARRTYEKAAAKNLLTANDEVQVSRLLRGEIELQNLDPAADNIKGITAVYEAKLEYERLTKLIKEYNQRRKAGLREEADGYLETANDWKDKKAGILYSRETMERNIRDIIKDKAMAEQVIQKYFKPVHDAQAKSAVTKNKYRDRVRALNLSRKVAKGNEVSEAHAVQLLGEAEDNIRMLEQSRGKMKERDGKSLSDWRGIVENLRAQNPQLDWKKIENAVAEFRKIYDELFKLMNEARLRNGYEPVNYRKGYFPHFQPGDGDGIIAQFGKALGIDTEVTALPTTINGMTHTFKPGIRWFGNAQERLGFNTAYDAVEGFDKYIEGVADVIHQTDNIQSLRALTSQMRYRTGEEGIRKQVDAVLTDTSLSEQDKQNRIDKIYESGKYALSNFVNELEEYTNLLANKKSKHDRQVESDAGRGFYNVVKWLESRVAANMVAINPASWLTNFIPLTQGGAQLDRGMLLKGMWDTLRAYKADDGIVAKSTFLTNRRGSDPIVRTWAQAASAKMSSPMEYIDQFVADTLVRARYQQNIKKGLSETEAMTEADAWVAGVMADRSKGSMPTLFNRSNPITKVFTQFQLEVNNQLSYLFKDIPREQKDKGVLALTVALLKFFIGAYLYNELYEYIIGRRPALDPLGILNDTVGNITGYELPNLMELGVGAITGDMPSFEVEKKDAYDTSKDVVSGVADQLPFMAAVGAFGLDETLGLDIDAGRIPLESAISNVGNVFKALTNEEWDTKKRVEEVADELLKPASYLALPFGGGQLKKIYQGLRAVIEGGSYTVNSEGEDVLQYPVYNDSAWDAATNAARAALFGKTSLPGGRDWIESGFKSFGAKETTAYQGMTAAGVPDDEAYQLLQDIRGVQKTDEESTDTLKRRLLQESDIDGAGKSVVYYGILASDKERELMDAMTDVDADMGVVTNVLMEIKDAGNLTGAAASNAKRDAIAEADLTDDEKEQVYQYMMGQKQEDGTYTSSRDDDIEAFRTAGLDFDQFIEAQNAYTTFNEEYSKAGEKATEFSRWVNSQTYTAEQAEIVKDSFKYFSQIPAEAGRYDGFMAAGLSDEASYELTGALNALEPEDGKDTVSSLQRYRAVVDAGLSVDEQMAAFSTLMDESEYARVQTGYSFGVTPAAYVSYKETLPLYDADGNGSFKQEEVEAAIDAMSGGGLQNWNNGLTNWNDPAEGKTLNLTNEQKAALWQMQNKSWKPRNNPYNTAISEKVYNALNAETEDTGLKNWNDTENTGGLTDWSNGVMLPTAEEAETASGLKNWN